MHVNSKTILFLITIVTMCLMSCKKTQNNKKQQKSEINFNQQNIQVAEQIKINQLQSALLKLQNGKTKYHFIGITSNGIDCIYIIYENGKFNIEFEAIAQQQIPYIEKLRQFANTNKFKNIMTTYNNKPEYKSQKPAPVLRVETNATLEEITKIATNMQSHIFNNTENTSYDVVP